MKGWYALLGFLLCASVAMATALGDTVSLRDVGHVIWYHLSFGQTQPADLIADRIVWQLRLPRAILAIVVGGGLAIVGTSMQALVRNPLAEPYILGISSGASAGASLFFLGFLPPLVSKGLSMPLAAFAGGLLAITIVYAVAGRNSRLSVARLLLAGVAVAALMASVTSFVSLSSPEPDKLRAVLFWLMGSLHNATWAVLPWPTIATLIGFGILFMLARSLDAMLLGEESAHNLGVRVELIKRLLIVLAALVTGSIVAASGAIGFVGLIVPHAVRMVTGVTHRRVLPACFMAGALFLLWADLAARLLLPGEQLPVGIVTALCGVPFFLFLLRRSNYGFGG